MRHARHTFQRLAGPPAVPRLITTGLEVTDDAAWAWAVVPDGSTALLEADELAAATWDSATALAAVLPSGAEYHLKVLWAPPTPQAYRAGWDRLRSVRAPGADTYLALGEHRIRRNAATGYFRRRIVLLGLALSGPAAGPSDSGGAGSTGGTGSLPEQLARAARRLVRSPSAARRDARTRAEQLRPRAEQWLRQLADSPLRATPAPAGLIAWAYGRELRRSALEPPAAEAPEYVDHGADRGGDRGGDCGGDVVAGPVLVDLAHGVMDPGADPRHVVVTDATTGRHRFMSILTPAALTGFPPDELVLPGGEWLQLLSELPGVEASVRGVCHGQAGSLTLLEHGRKLGRSQAREAAEHGAAVPIDVQAADLALTERHLEVQRRTDVMTTHHARWVVDADSVEELAARVTALRQRYAGLIRLEVVPHVQGLLWQELLPGDRVRVPEFAQHAPLRTLAGSWFHGGSAVGDTTGPYLGANLGSTPGPVQLHVVSRAETDLARPTTISVTGMSGTGKSTAVMLMILGALAESAWCLLVDPKGDLAGLVGPARDLLGVPVQLIDVLHTQASGTMDPMRFCATADDARSLTVDALLGALSPEDRRHGESLIEAAVDAVLRFPREAWSAHRVITELATTPIPDPGTAPRAAFADGTTPGSPVGTNTAADTNTAASAAVAAAHLARQLGHVLTVRARHPAMRAVLGPASSDAPSLHTGRGLVYLSLAGLPLPRHTPDPAHWSIAERCAMTTVQVALSYALQMSRTVRERKKLVALSELHLITAYPQGRAVVGWLARTGRALQTWLLLDSQSADDLAGIGGLVEQLVMSLAFRAHTRAEQDAQAVLLGRPDPGPRLRGAQAGLGTGECLLRDRHGRLGLVAIDRLTRWLADDLATDAPDDLPDEAQDLPDSTPDDAPDAAAGGAADETGIDRPSVDARAPAATGPPGLADADPAGVAGVAGVADGTDAGTGLDDDLDIHTGTGSRRGTAGADPAGGAAGER